MIALFGAKGVAYTKHDMDRITPNVSRASVQQAASRPPPASSDDATSSRAASSRESIPKPEPGQGTGSDKSFLERASPNTLEIYQSVMWNVDDRYGRVIEMFEVEGSGERHIYVTLSYQRLQVDQPLTDAELYDRIRRTAASKHELQIFESFLMFNKHVLKTKFYQRTKVALSFKLERGFMPEVDYPRKAFGMFLVVGSDFRGFHVRFKDVARGGIRIVLSKGKECSINQRMLFDENYALGSTENVKNKDIPEGGAKGTILASLDASPKLCFEKYIDANVDLLSPGQKPGIKEPIGERPGRYIDFTGTMEETSSDPGRLTADLEDRGQLFDDSAVWYNDVTAPDYELTDIIEGILEIPHKLKPRCS
ncbi:hypothetical protein AURDEDRAFT_176868 [Auricularia subglabra TFB-10046 SS5]|uniref:Uncharacterized protein n=1 Tax=Auricularia subglabra (strain TFB-10046 / SS5) TaxID=717982 RepID=J0LC73_AURST|nr:hypothetical protein AURDEDRAFT_176868 [Auricularia subglabra TFB-10046 SS5]